MGSADTRDRRLAWCWALTALVALVDSACLARAGWAPPWRTLGGVALADLALAAPLLLDRYRREARLAAMLGAAALLVTFSACAATLSYLAVAANAPLVDAPLAAADRSLGFDFAAAQAAVHAHPRLAHAFALAYASGLAQIALVVLALGTAGRLTQLSAFLRAFCLATLAAIAVSAVLPAAGPWTYLGTGTPEQRAVLAHFEALRAGTLRDFPGAAAQGLISMPSLHAAGAVLLMAALRGTRLALPACAWNLLMLASTPTCGGHYLVDVIAGIALAAAAIAADRALAAPRRRPAPTCAARHDPVMEATR